MESEKNTALSGRLIVFFVLAALFARPGNVLADHAELVKGKKVLIVASYHREYKWTGDIVQALEKDLAGADLTVFYMNSKGNLEGAAEKAEEAFALYRELSPDAVITIDDNAQAYFVVPYLRNKVATPVFFCGVNNDAAKSGEEQAVLAASQLIAHWEGTPIKDIPVTWNKNGQRYINLKTLKKLQLILRPEMIIGTTIIAGN